MRVVKDAYERRNEILDAAGELFERKGFDGTSTNDILEKVKIARGTLYYHFKSKEDIMNAYIERYSRRMLNAAREIASNSSIPVNERIYRTVMELRIESGNDNQIMNHLHKPQNVLMHHKIQKMIVNDLTPILSGIIKDGIRQGIYDTPYPYECMEMVVAYTNTVFDEDIVELSEDELTVRIKAFIFNTERLLGAKTGSFIYGMKMFGY